LLLLLLRVVVVVVWRLVLGVGMGLATQVGLT
jgi:hypothetical protein